MLCAGTALPRQRDAMITGLTNVHAAIEQNGKIEAVASSHIGDPHPALRTVFQNA